MLRKMLGQLNHSATFEEAAPLILELARQIGRGAKAEEVIACGSVEEREELIVSLCTFYDLIPNMEWLSEKTRSKYPQQVSVDQYARLHGISSDTVRQRIHRGSYTSARKIGRSWVLNKDEPHLDHRTSKEQRYSTPVLCDAPHKKKRFRVEYVKVLSGVWAAPRETVVEAENTTEVLAQMDSVAGDSKWYVTKITSV